MKEIPKLAWFYWEGEAMSPLRRISMESFGRLNPGWDIRLMGSDPSTNPALNQIPGLRGIILRSDYARYEALAEQGGFYFDTDFVFVKPIPQEWMEAEVTLSVDDERRCVSVANLGGVPDNAFFEYMKSRADACISTSALLSHQDLGIILFHKNAKNVARTCSECGLKFKDMPVKSILTVPSHTIYKLWISDTTLEIPESSVAIHWYGGDSLSQEFENDIPSGCIVDKAINA